MSRDAAVVAVALKRPCRASTTSAAPGAATAKAIAALSAATSSGSVNQSQSTPAPTKRTSKAVPVDTPKSVMPQADPSTDADTPMPAAAGGGSAAAAAAGSPIGSSGLESEVTTPLADDGPSIDDL
jgi:hypothetical protein